MYSFLNLSKMFYLNKLISILILSTWVSNPNETSIKFFWEPMDSICDGKDICSDVEIQSLYNFLLA